METERQQRHTAATATTRTGHLVVELKVGVHLETGVEGFDRVAIAAVAIVQQPDAVPKARILFQHDNGTREEQYRKGAVGSGMG